MSYRKVTITMPKELHKKISSYAKKQTANVSYVIRIAVKQYLDKQESEYE